jgi:hypothetical protein
MRGQYHAAAAGSQGGLNLPGWRARMVRYEPTKSSECVVPQLGSGLAAGRFTRSVVREMQQR